MKKQKQQRITKAQKRFSFQLHKTANFTIRDFQRHCIVRGMPFEDLAKMDVPTMSKWLYTNTTAPIDTGLLDKYDEWKEAYLKKERNMGDDFFHPDLRLGFIGEKDDDGKILKRKRIKGLKKKKEKREKTEQGLYQGTKKALTYLLTSQGYSLEEVIKKVKESFPDAKDKSIHIWMKKAIRSGIKVEKREEVKTEKPRVNEKGKGSTKAKVGLKKHKPK